MDIREEIPVKSFMVAVCVCRIEDGFGKYLGQVMGYLYRQVKNTSTKAECLQIL